MYCDVCKDGLIPECFESLVESVLLRYAQLFIRISLSPLYKTSKPVSDILTSSQDNVDRRQLL